MSVRLGVRPPALAREEPDRTDAVLRSREAAAKRRVERLDSPPPAVEALPALDRRPDLRTRLDAERRSLNDPGAKFLRQRLELDLARRPRPVPLPTTLPTTRDPSVPYQPLSQAQFDQVMAAGNTDPKALDAVDNFRQTLPPAQQAEYDAMLAKLRSDPRIVVRDEPGATTTPAERELMLRGLAAASFNDPKGLEATLTKASAQDGEFTLRAFNGPVPVGRFYGSGGDAAGLALPEGGVAIDLNFLRDGSRQGDNPLVHEFSHVQQSTLGEDGKLSYSERYPPNFPFGDVLTSELETPEFKAFLGRTGYGADGIETWPTIQNLFHQQPDVLREASPAMYEAMVKYQGFDPLTGQSSPPVRLGGDGSLAQSVPALSAHFDAVAGPDGQITATDLERVAADASADPELRAATQFVLGSETGRRFLDVAAGRGALDGKISARDLDAASRWLATHGSDLDAPAPASPGSGPVVAPAERTARAVLEKYAQLFDTASGKPGRDGFISLGDLRAVASDESLPRHVRAAAAYFLQHPDAWKRAQG